MDKEFGTDTEMANLFEKNLKLSQMDMSSRECATYLLKNSGLFERQVSFLDEALRNISECFTVINEKDCLLELGSLNSKYHGNVSEVIIVVRSLKFECRSVSHRGCRTYCLDLDESWNANLVRKKSAIVRRHGWGVSEHIIQSKELAVYI